MKKILSKMIGSSIIISLLIVPIISVKALATGTANAPVPASFEKLKQAEQNKIEMIRNNTTAKLQALKLAEEARLRQIKASTTIKMLENRQNNIERVLARLASTTASTTAKKIEKLNDQLAKQREQMANVKDRLINKEGNVTAALEKIAKNISDRINTLADKGLDMTAARAKLAEATASIAQITDEADKIATAIQTTITDTNKVQIFQEVKTAQDQIRTLAGQAKALLIDTIKEITKVLPKNGRATSTATSTDR